MKKIILITILLLSIIFTASGLTLKLASPVPEGSEWHRALSEMAREWSEITQGAVRIRIYPGGIAGTGSDIVRKMRIGQVDMAIMTAPTLATIVPDTFSMSMPFYLRSEAELDYVLERMAPSFDEAFEEKGFRVLGWSKSGWVNIFSTSELRTPEDLKKLKFAVSPEDQEGINAYKETGFNVIPLDMKDVLMGLQSGMIDSFYTSPMAAASYQWFGLAPYMLDFKIAPVVGGIIISERTWRRIPSRFHEDLKASVKRTADNFYEKTKEMEELAMDVMADHGLQRVEISDSEEELWITLLGEDYSAFVGRRKVISRDVFDRFSALVESYRGQ